LGCGSSRKSRNSGGVSVPTSCAIAGAAAPNAHSAANGRNQFPNGLIIGSDRGDKAESMVNGGRE
jgi:hypothetical protein